MSDTSLPEQSRIQPLARHGSTLVYIGRLPRSEREVVLKICFTPFMSPLQQQQAYLHVRREMSRLQALKHPHIMMPLLVRRTSQGLVLVSTYAPGGSLQQFLPGPMPQSRALAIIRQIGEALQAAHQQGIVHGNLLPSNVLFMRRAPAGDAENEGGDDQQQVTPEQTDQVVLSDFYLPSLASIQIVNSGNDQPQLWHYMAPEQFQDERSTLTDQYSLAAIAYELFTGQTPFAGSARTTLRYKHSYTPPNAADVLNPDLPATIARALNRGLAKDPARRFASIQDFLTALEGVDPSIADAVVAPPPLKTDDIAAPAVSVAAGAALSREVTDAGSPKDGVTRPRGKRKRWLLPTAVLVFLLLAGSIFYASGLYMPLVGGSTGSATPTALTTASPTMTQRVRSGPTATVMPHATPTSSTGITFAMTPTPVPTATATALARTTATPAAQVSATSTPVPTTDPATVPVGSGVVQPILECVHLQGASGYVAKFGYLNTSSNNVTIPVGVDNMITPSQYSSSLPTNFSPGRQTAVVQINAPNSTVLVWMLNGSTATASNLSPRC